VRGNQPTNPASDEERADRDLLAALQAGDSAAFDSLYRRHRDWVTRLAHRTTGSASDALDVLQETFLYLLRKAPTLELHARLTTFLFPVVRHLSLQRRRRRPTEPLAERDEPLATDPPLAPPEDLLAAPREPAGRTAGGRAAALRRRPVAAGSRRPPGECRSAP
jgi:DNA-directed RNA polymerase specialized sigma24 family protein